METDLFDLGRNDQIPVSFSKSEDGASSKVRLDEEVHFSCEEHKASFERLTIRQQEYIAAYMKTGSPTETARIMKITGSTKGVSKRLTQIAKLMGLNGVRDLTTRNYKTSATAADLKTMVEKQKYRCALSGIKLTPDTSQLDHIEPLATNGTNEISNLQWLDSVVNKAKGTMSQAEFIQMCRRVAQWNG